ncbi:uncharacterized protein MEPE_02079 [Melanopsichium pennsylvanicum]|uniref:Bromo domain-containing protein n=2 Tax=Melanopsichium pennsylvanicum TaxID=63383 RepID=A0AAJ5C485_9BASI|nr:putative protein [Melanopsichium pennsylvanicum 4]SNX83372.1 uncharacterized protein MEPE_02079 [Melanopsichium pennsylvanicum]
MATSTMASEDGQVNGTSASYPVASSSSAASQSRKAIMLKGPSLTSKTYFVPLPNTLDQLVARAVELFPVPPGKVPYITLGTDERAIILEESYDFVRDRELLHFRWSAETPRRNLANRVRWNAPSDSTSATPFSFNLTTSPQNSSSETSVTSSVTSAGEALKPQAQASPSSKKDLASTTRANTIANRDPSTQFGEGVAARKAHVQRVLAEQQRKREEEHTADALGAAPILVDAEPETMPDADPEATAKAALELAEISSSSDDIPKIVALSQVDAASRASLKDVDMPIKEDHSSPIDIEAPSPADVVSSDAKLAPIAATVDLQSPPRKKHADAGGLDTPPSSGSRSSSPFHSSDRSLGSTRALDRGVCDDEPSSSPIPSPTRDVSSRYRNALSTVPVPELGKIPVLVSAGLEDKANHVVANELVTDAITTANEESETLSQMHQQDIELVAEESESPSKTASPTSPTSAKPAEGQSNDRELNRIYSFLSNLVSQLLSHKANWAFQRPMSVEFEQFSSRSSRSVDLFSIRDSLASRKYGSQHLGGRIAANAVVTDFEDDLTMLYTNARQFFGVRSTEAECVEHLEKFSRSFLNEWKRTQGSAAQTKAAAQLSSDAAARLSAFRSPGWRSEKRPTSLSYSPFAMLLTPGSATANAGAANLSGKRAAGINGPPHSLSLLRRPDFGFKRNTSYEGTLSAAAKRPAQPTMTTSEAFERALRAATATPQAQRVKPRQEVVAPFTTRSVIETDFIARTAHPQQQQHQQEAEVLPDAAAHTPTSAGTKRKFSQATLDVENEMSSSQESLPRTPSVSPPPSPSPTKRTRQVLTLKPSKSAARRINKKKAKQAAAAAAAAAAVELTEQKQREKKVTVSSGDLDEEQRVLELLAPSLPAAKRARTRVSNSPVVSEPSTPELPHSASGKGKGKKSKATPTAGSETTSTINPPLPATPSGRILRSRRTNKSTSNGDNFEAGVVTPPKTRPRSAMEGNGAKTTATTMDMVEDYQRVIETLDVNGFQMTGSKRRSSRQRRPVNLD